MPLLRISVVTMLRSSKEVKVSYDYPEPSYERNTFDYDLRTSNIFASNILNVQFTKLGRWEIWAHLIRTDFQS